MNPLQKKNDDLIGSMLEMCDQMMDVLDEHGGARNKYIKMKNKEMNDNIHKAYYYKDVSDAMTGKASKTAAIKSNKYYDKAKQNLSDAHEVVSPNDYSTIDSYLDYVKNPNNKSNSTKGKDIFMKKYGGPSTGKLGHDKPGEIKALQDKKRAIKETCLNILSIIDEL